jgi:hypothetical protein
MWDRNFLKEVCMKNSIKAKVKVYYENLDDFEFVVESILNKLNLNYAAYVNISNPFKIHFYSYDEDEQFEIKFEAKSVRVNLDGYVDIEIFVSGEVFSKIVEKIRG